MLGANDPAGLPLLLAAATGGTPIPLIAIAAALAGVLGGAGGLLTAQATRSRGATEGFRDLTTDLQEERDRLADRNAELEAELTRLRFVCWNARIDWRPPQTTAPQPSPDPGGSS